MKTHTLLSCSVVTFLVFVNVGYGASDFLYSAEESKTPHRADDGTFLLASNQSLETLTHIQGTLIQHEATERQRKIAQMHAAAFIKHLEPERKAAMKRKKVRYIAVDTERNAQTSPKAKKVVMVWDTQSESLVGNTVYDLPNPPSVGKSIVFTTYAAEYVGGGN